MVGGMGCLPVNLLWACDAAFELPFLVGFRHPVLGFRGQRQWQPGWDCRVSALLEKVVMPMPLPSSPFLEEGLLP